MYIAEAPLKNQSQVPCPGLGVPWSAHIPNIPLGPSTVDQNESSWKELLRPEPLHCKGAVPTQGPGVLTVRRTPCGLVVVKSTHSSSHEIWSGPQDRHKLRSSKLIWKWRGAPDKTSVLYLGPSMSFHVKLGEGNTPSWAIAAIWYAYTLKDPSQT